MAFVEYDIAYQSDTVDAEAEPQIPAEPTFPGYDVVADQKVQLMPVVLLRHDTTESH